MALDTITSLPTPIHPMSALPEVLFGLCACTPVEVPFTARKPARVVIRSAPSKVPDDPGALRPLGCTPSIRDRRPLEFLAFSRRQRGDLRSPPKVRYYWTFAGVELCGKTSDLRDSKADEWAEGYRRRLVTTTVLPVTPGGSYPQQLYIKSLLVGLEMWRAGRQVGNHLSNANPLTSSVAENDPPPGFT